MTTSQRPLTLFSGGKTFKLSTPRHSPAVLWTCAIVMALSKEVNSRHPTATPAAPRQALEVATNACTASPWYERGATSIRHPTASPGNASTMWRCQTSGPVGWYVIKFSEVKSPSDPSRDVQVNTFVQPSTVVDTSGVHCSAETGAEIISVHAPCRKRVVSTIKVLSERRVSV